MTPVLQGLRIVEGSAFVAAPLGGMTLAQLGADVIRFDAIGGGLDYQRWPVTEEGVSLFLGRPKQRQALYPSGSAKRHRKRLSYTVDNRTG